MSTRTHGRAVLAALSLVGAISLIASQSRRYITRRIVPFLVRPLTPLQPTRAEHVGVERASRPVLRRDKSVVGDLPAEMP